MDDGRELVDLEIDDLHALRLAAQVLGHKAELAGRPRVAAYFSRLSDGALAELAGRGEGLVVVRTAVSGGLDDGADSEDRRLLAEYLSLLVANERLSSELRQKIRWLRTRDCR